ncbi:MAG: selenocysteine-specific translation elongation factor [Chloroflexi bacterium]|nr:selenocysteine-specific translation elongation factor [Chloroflexota bacterium]
MRVIGTAGHVDHGKSTLVKCLTGIDPDRLAEEKAREMTIDLGFAWLSLPGLPDGEMVGIVDVPGHRDFIENMLAGVGGIDAALLVIAADEGIMPQTREHLAILNLLGIHHAVVALTKVDMVEDPDWLYLVSEEVAEALAQTPLAGAAILPVSANTGQGIPELLTALATLLKSLPPRRDRGVARMPIDRVFTIGGFGTVVTGTLRGGALHVGDEVVIEPAGLTGRVRGLQSYQTSTTKALPGTRTAVNVTGLDRQEIQRGQVLTRPGFIQPTDLFDAQVRLLPDIDRPLAHNTEVKVFVGTAEALGHVRVLAEEALQPGETGWIQVRTDEPLALVRGDRFILRLPSPPQTIGGGVVVQSNAPSRYRRFQQDVIDRLERLVRGSPAELVADAAASDEPSSRSALASRVDLEPAEFEQALEEAEQQGLIVRLNDGTWMESGRYEAQIDRLHGVLANYHAAYPLKAGMAREELRSRMGIRTAALTALLDSSDLFSSETTVVRLANHAVHLTSEQEQRLADLLQRFEAVPYTPPSFQEAATQVGEDVLRAAIDLGRLIQVAPDVLFGPEAYGALVSGTLDLIDQDGSVTVAALRDRYGTSRKYAIALLEHLDALGTTRRQGDARVRSIR